MAQGRVLGRVGADVEKARRVDACGRHKCPAGHAGVTVVQGTAAGECLTSTATSRRHGLIEGRVRRECAKRRRLRMRTHQQLEVAPAYGTTPAKAGLGAAAIEVAVWQNLSVPMHNPFSWRTPSAEQPRAHTDRVDWRWALVGGSPRRRLAATITTTAREFTECRVQIGYVHKAVQHGATSRAWKPTTSDQPQATHATLPVAAATAAQRGGGNRWRPAPDGDAGVIACKHEQRRPRRGRRRNAAMRGPTHLSIRETMAIHDRCGSGRRWRRRQWPQILVFDGRGCAHPGAPSGGRAECQYAQSHAR